MEAAEVGKNSVPEQIDSAAAGAAVNLENTAHLHYKTPHEHSQTASAQGRDVVARLAVGKEESLATLDLQRVAAGNFVALQASVNVNSHQPRDTAC